MIDFSKWKSNKKKYIYIYSVPHIYNSVEQEVMAGQFHAPSHPGVLKNVYMYI